MNSWMFLSLPSHSWYYRRTPLRLPFYVGTAIKFKSSWLNTKQVTPQAISSAPDKSFFDTLLDMGCYTKQWTECVTKAVVTRGGCHLQLLQLGVSCYACCCCWNARKASRVIRQWEGMARAESVSCLSITVECFLVVPTSQSTNLAT